MKGTLVGNNKRGFSTLEIVIALAISAFIIVGAFDASMGTAYWALASETASESLSVVKNALEEVRIIAQSDFQSASTSEWVKEQNPADHYASSCIQGGLCYFSRAVIEDISSCRKDIESGVAWQLSENYATTTTSLQTYLVDEHDIERRWSDCSVQKLPHWWGINTPRSLDTTERAFEIFQTGIDVLGATVYISASSSPQLSVFDVKDGTFESKGEWGGEAGSVRLNALDAVIDRKNNKRYVFATQHSTTTQLAVFDVTDSGNTTRVAARSLSGVLPTSSFPEGWRLAAYDNRLYITTRETAGPELHVFDISNPENPVEIISARRELNRTVNDMFVREQVIHGTLRRLLFLVADSNLKEAAIWDVVHDVPVERVAINLPGNQDALSLSLLGNEFFIGRARTNGGPELYQFNVLELFDGISIPKATGELDATIHTIKSSGDFLFLGTNKLGAELATWSSNSSTWSSGKLSAYEFPRLAPLGFDFANGNIVGISQSSAETIRYITSEP